MQQRDHPECMNYDKCTFAHRDQMAHPIDQKSLYASRIYDNQTANRKCYATNPINVVEAFNFGEGMFTTKNILKIIIAALALYLIYRVFIQKKEVSVGIKAATATLGDTPIKQFRGLVKN